MSKEKRPTVQNTAEPECNAMHQIDNEKIETVAQQVLERYLPAFRELAK